MPKPHKRTTYKTSSGKTRKIKPLTKKKVKKAFKAPKRNKR